MNSQNRLIPTGEWVGFFLDFRHPDQRGWMQMYLEFNQQKIKGEGTDWVGAWQILGEYDLERQDCRWEKRYLGKHTVQYQGKVDENGIIGNWNIGFFSDRFHIWPRAMGHLQEMYLQQDLALGSDP